MAAMNTVRIRVVFDNPILTQSQKTQGLRKFWVLLKPQHQTISDLSSYLLHIFDLHHACPQGLLLSMEGFVLPGFESTCILKDKDIIRVKKKEGGRRGESCEIVKIDDGLNNSLDVVEIVDKPTPVFAGMNLLANEEFEKAAGGYESETDEDEQEETKDRVEVENTPEVEPVSKKRKALKESRSPKRKKIKSASAVKCVAVSENVGKNAHAEQNGTLSISKPDGSISKGGKAMSNAKKSGQPEENGNGSVDASHTLCGTEKLPSRSARRKKAKRQWLKERLKAEKEQHQRQSLAKNSPQSSEKDNRKVSEESLEKGNCKISEEPMQDNLCREQDGNVEDDDVVPVVIRPGHIRFEPLNKGGPDQAVQQNQISAENFQWNGTRSKKKGQKWGKEKALSCKWNERGKEKAVSCKWNDWGKEKEKAVACKWNDWGKEEAESGKWNDDSNFKKESSKILTTGEETPVYNPIDFVELPLYASLPKEGDIIAYRLIELSSSWTPELSSYRVGKISQYDLESNRITLVQVPEYPISHEKNIDDEASAAQTESYRKDGSLQTKFSSLFEVRLVNQGNQNSAKSVAGGATEVNIGDQDSGTGFRSNNNNEAGTSGQENGKVNGWEEINQVLNAKKAELEGGNWSKAESSGRSTWSCKALRGSALGPTVALLRAQNEL